MKRAPLALAAVAASVLALAGCSGTASPGSSTPGTDTIAVLASTNVYGQIVEEVGGDHVEVTSIISSSSADPHEFEASASDQLAVKNADLIVQNGGGYDAFMESLISGSGSSAPVLTAATFSPEWPEDAKADDEVEGFNEHVWYDPATMRVVAGEIATELGKLDPDAASEFTANADAFGAEIDGLQDSLSEIETAHAGAGVFVTEPVPGYLVAAAGLENVTPEEFSEAVEEEQDVPPATLLEALGLIDDGKVAVVIANAQTGGAETTQVIDAADAKGVPVLEFSETLPDGKTYIQWMQDNIAALAGALGT